jgi:putative DNA methylase
MSDTPISSEHIYSEANAGRMGARMMAVVAEGKSWQGLFAPTPEMEAVAIMAAVPLWKPELLMPENPRWFWTASIRPEVLWRSLHSAQLVALTTFSDLVQEAREHQG